MVAAKEETMSEVLAHATCVRLTKGLRSLNHVLCVWQMRGEDGGLM